MSHAGSSALRSPQPGVRIALGSALLVLAACGSSPTKPSPPPPVDPPKITCPADISVTSPNGAPTAVSYGAATAAGGQAPVTVTCTPASGTEFPVGQTKVTCTATDALQRTDACSLTVTVLAPPKLKVTRFLAFGDSITWGEDGTNLTTSSTDRFRPRARLPLAETYPAVLQQKLLSRYLTQTPSVFNAGDPGESLTGTDSNAFARFVSLTSTRQWDVVLIMEGTNDVTREDDTIFRAAIAVLQQMINDARSRMMTPLLATIPPMNPKGGGGGIPDRGRAAALVPEFNGMVTTLAQSQGVTLVDVYSALVGDIAMYIGPDGLHPTVAGYAKIADTLFSTIRQTLEQPAPNPTALPMGLPSAFRPPISRR